MALLLLLLYAVPKLDAGVAWQDKGAHLHWRA
jgi:hypothetical protein